MDNTPYKIIRIDSTESTNTYAKSLPAPETDSTPLVVITDNQTRGRGQRGNSWESEAGSNLTFSLTVYPRWMSPSHQFELSMLVSVGLVNALRSFVGTTDWFSVKWPNDIYYGDKKIAGILIENSVNGPSIERSVIGIGINVNQKVFVSDAPNPVSLCHLTDCDIDRDALLDKILDCILDIIDSYSSDPEPDELSALYNSMLWRNDSAFHLWLDTASHTVFSAVLDRVELDGRILLTDSSGATRSFLFKEVSAVL